MAAPPAELAALRSFLWASDALYAAVVGPDGSILDANPALGGRALAGVALGELVSAPQRPALRAALAAAGDGRRLTLTFFLDGRPPEDRTLRVLPAEEGMLVVAEPERLARDQLVEQVLALNDELVGAQRALGRRQRELERARAEAEAATRRAGQLEAITLTGMTHPRMDDAPAALLEIAQSILGSDGAALLLLEEGRPGLQVRAAAGEAGADPRLAADVARAGQPVIAGGEGGSVAGVPLRLEGAVIGVLQVRSERAGAFGQDDLRLLELVGERAALAIGHAQLRERERGISETLQRSLLPDRLPEVAGISIVARYLPQMESVHVGGDFYDAVVLPDGALSLAIGDVAGKGLRAAALMGNLRSTLRAYAVDGRAPDEVVVRLDRAVVDAEDFATALHLVLDPVTGAASFASAGHPLPLRLRPGGGAEPIGGAIGPPLGLGVAARERAVLELAPGEALVFFTDGLFERRGEDPEARLGALRAAAEGAAGDLDAVCDHLLAALAGGGYEDDVALLAVRREVA